MCGIIYVKRADGKPARKQVMKQYKKQEERGNEGYGYVGIIDGKIAEYKRTQTESEIKKEIKESTADQILFHHRYPTSTVNIPESAHPIIVRNKELQHNYYIVHNGIISNSNELRKEHTKLGYRYTTEVKTMYQTEGGQIYHGESEVNDSETLAIELARTIEGLQPKVLAQGSIAYIALQVQNGTACAVYYGTNGRSPLTIKETAQGVMIASEGGKPIIDEICYKLDLRTGKTEIACVPLIDYPKPILGYGYAQPYTDYKGYKGYKGQYADDEYDEGDYKTIGEITEGITAEMEAIEADISIAEQAGEQEEAEYLKEYYAELVNERNLKTLGIS